MDIRHINTRKARSGLLLIALMAVIALLLAACNDAEEPAAVEEPLAEETEPEPEPEAEEAEEADPLAPLEAEVSVRVGVLRVVNLAPLWLLEEAAAEYNLDVEFVEFSRFADERTALAAEEIDFTAFGPQDIALAMADGNDNIVGLAGTGTGNDTLIARVGAGIESWEDLVGMRVGIGAGSISWVKFAASVAEQGVNYEELNIVNIAGGGSAYVQAIERGDIDLGVVWEPFGAQAMEEGVGEYPPFDHNQSEVVGGAFATFSTTTRNIQERPEVVQAMVNAYVDSVEQMMADRDVWVDVAEDFSGLERETVETAISRSELDYVLDLERILNIAEFLIDNGVISDVDLDELAAAHDYSFLSARTGESPEALGRTN